MIILYIILAIVAIIILWFILLFISGLFIDTKKDYDKNSRYYRFLLNFSTAVAMKLIRVRITLHGEEMLPLDKRFLLVSNHRSNFDPLITWHALAKYDLAFISKPENFKIPFFGKIIRKCCFMSIDRHDPRKALVTKERAARLIKSGEVNVAVYPEGTRSRTGELLPFHNGIFNIAKEADCPIYIMIHRGTAEVQKNYPWHHSDVSIEITDCIPLEDVRTMSPHDLGERARASMLRVLGK